MRKKVEHTAPPDFVTVTCLRTIDWNHNDSRQFIKGQEYSLPNHVYKSLAKYFVISDIKETNDGE